MISSRDSFTFEYLCDFIYLRFFILQFFFTIFSFALFKTNVSNRLSWMDRYSFLHTFPCIIELSLIPMRYWKKLEKKRIDCFLKIKIQWIRSSYLRSSNLIELGWNQARNQSRQTETVDFSLCFSSSFQSPRSLPLFRLPTSSSFYQDGKRSKYLVSNSTEPTFPRIYRRSLISKIQ